MTGMLAPIHQARPLPVSCRPDPYEDLVTTALEAGRNEGLRLDAQAANPSVPNFLSVTPVIFRTLHPLLHSVIYTTVRRLGP